MNPRAGYSRPTAFRVRTLQPLGYISKGQRLLYQKFCYLSRADGGKIIQLDDRRNQRSPASYFCVFRHGGLNARLQANIQPTVIESQI